MTELHSAAVALFQVIATGHPLPGAAAEQVHARLQTLLKLPPATAARLLAGKPVVLKRALTAALAEDYCARLRSAGIAVDIAPMPAAAPTAATTTPAEPIIDFFTDTGAIETLVPISLRLRLWPQTLTALALPVGYGLCVLLVLGAVLAFAIHFATLLRTPPLFFSLPVYLLPLLGGLVLVAILLRPLLPLRAAVDTSIPIAANCEPQLLVLLTQLCRRLGAAPPARVRLHLDNALVKKDVDIDLLPGGDGWQRGHYELRIGLPLLLNASMPALVGALAAELVFAREPRLLRLRVMVMRVCAWLTQSAQLQPDRFSRYLDTLPEKPWCDWLRRADRWIRAQLARLFETLSLRSSHQAAGTLSQIGDRASVAVAGVGSVSARILTAYRLERACERALQKNSERRIDPRLVDDLAPLIGFFFEHSDTAYEKKLARSIEAGDARQNGCRSDRERIAAAETMACEFSPPTLCERLALQHVASGRDCTEKFYASKGIAVGDRMPSERLLDDALLDLEQAEAGAVYFNDWLIPARGWRLPDVELLRDMPHADARLQLNVCVNEVRRLTPDRAKLLTEFARLQTQLNELTLGQQVLAANNKFSFRHIKFDGTSLAPLIEQRQRDIAKIVEQLGTQESIMGGRIALGLKLFGQDGSATTALHRTLHFLGEQEKALYRLETETTLLEQLIQRRRQLKERGYTDAISRLSEKVRDTTLRLLDKLKDAPSPPDRRYSPLSAFVENREIENREIENRAGRSGTDATATAARARSVLDGFYTLNEKLSLLAAEQASSVEEAYKIERIRLVNAE